MRREGQDGARREHSLDIARDRVDLEIDAAADGQAAQGGVLDGVRDQVDAEGAGRGAVGDAVDGEADAVDRDRSLQREVARQRRRRGDLEQPRFAGALEARDGADAVDVAADQVAVEPVAGAQGLLEIDFAGGVEAVGGGEALGRDLDLEAMVRGVDRDDGHAGAGERDAVADGAMAEPAGGRLDRQRLAERRVGAERVDVDDPADAADDAGEHAPIVLAGATRWRRPGVSGARSASGGDGSSGGDRSTAALRPAAAAATAAAGRRRRARCS